MRLRGVKKGVKRALFSMPKPISVFLAKAGASLGLWGKIQIHYCRLGCPRQVLSGPFQGMAWEPADTGGAWLPKIIGTYEKELHPFLDSLKGAPFAVLADIGCADGYYVIGLERAFRFKKIYAYDTDPYALRCLRRKAAQDRIQKKVVTREKCSAEILELDLKDGLRPLIICDCEGAELEILNPDLCPSLRAATLLVEVHDFPPPGEIGKALRQRFRFTHRMTTIQSKPRSTEDLPRMAAVLERDWFTALDEERATTMEWLLFEPL